MERRKTGHDKKEDDGDLNECTERNGKKSRGRGGTNEVRERETKCRKWRRTMNKKT